jgi:hypothetical protein
VRAAAGYFTSLRLEIPFEIVPPRLGKGCVGNRWLSTVEVTRMPVCRKAEEPYGCGWVRNRQRRSWGGSAHTREKDEAPILKKHRGFIP